MAVPRTRKPRPPGYTKAAGYGTEHKKIRARLIARLRRGEPMHCSRCGLDLRPGDRVHLDHAPGKAGYLGLAHAHCNTSAGAAYGNRLRAVKSRTWPSARDW